MLVDGRIFFNKEVPLRYVSFRLVVVVIAHEVLHRVIREEVSHFRVELGSKGFIRRHDQRRQTGSSDNVCHRVSFAASSHTKQRLGRKAVFNAFDELFDGLRLISGRLKWLMQFKRRIGEFDDFQGGVCLKNPLNLKSLERIARSPLRKNPIWLIQVRINLVDIPLTLIHTPRIFGPIFGCTPNYPIVFNEFIMILFM